MPELARATETQAVEAPQTGQVPEPHAPLASPAFTIFPMSIAAADSTGHGNPAALRRLRDGDDPLGGANVDDAIAPVLRRRRGRGEPLPTGMGDSMGAQLGIDTSSVRVHHDAEAGSVARSIQATAFTHGDDIYFAPGAYRPSSPQGQRVLAHELSHVAAQRSGADRGGAGAGGLTVGRADDPAEAAADRSAERVLSALRRTPAAVDAAEQPRTRPVPLELRRSFAGPATAGTIRRAPGTGGAAVAAAPMNRRQRRAAARAAAAHGEPAPAPAAAEAPAPAQTPAEAPATAEAPAEAPGPAEASPAPPMNRRQRRAAARAAAAAPSSAETAPAQGSATPEAATPEPTPEERWATALAGGDEAKAQTLLELRNADASIVPWLDAQAKVWPKVAYAAAHRAELGTPFDPARFDLFYGRQAMVPAMAALLTRDAEPWSVANIQSVLGKAGVPTTASKYLTACVTCSLTAPQALALATGCDAKVLAGLGDSAALQAQLTQVKKTWTDFSKIALLFNAFHTKQPNFPLLAQLVEACVTHAWAQDDVKKLVDGLKAAPLKEVAETADLQLKIQNVSQKWKNWTQLADVIDTGHAKGMSAADKTALLDECATQQKGTMYTATAAKRYIEVASTAAGYTWATRLVQVQNFRNHVQPAGLTNDFGGSYPLLATYTIPAVAAKNYDERVAKIGLPGNKVRHVLDGHSYEGYCFTIPNVRRSKFSSMLAPGADVPGKIQSAVTAGRTAQIENAARNKSGDPGGTQDKAGTYVIAYSYRGVISRPLSAKPAIPRGPGQRGRPALPAKPGVYDVAVSQYYPDGAGMYHKLASELAEAIGCLRGYIA